jgi:ABC-2 type transport system permease protein
MKTILYILQKEFIQVFRNRTMLPMIFFVPLVQMLILVYAATFEMKKIDFYVVDNDLSQTSRSLTAKFEGIPFFHMSGSSFSAQDGEEAMISNDADLVLVIPSGFEHNLLREDKTSIQLLANAIDGNSAQLAYSYSNFIISDFNRKLIAEWKGLPDFKPPMNIDIADIYWFNTALDYKWYMAPGILAILVTVIGMFLSGMNLVREKEIGTIEQLNVTPIRKYQFIIGKLVPFWLIALFDLAFGLLIAKFFFNLPIVGSLWVLFGFAGLYLVSVLGLGLFISTLADTQQQVMFISFFFMMIFILMGGIFTPVESMPHWAQVADRFNPMYYFMRILRMVVLKGSGFSDLVTEFFSLAALGITFLSLAIWRYRKTA